MKKRWGSAGRTGCHLQATNLDVPGDLREQLAPLVLELTSQLSWELDRLRDLGGEPRPPSTSMSYTSMASGASTVAAAPPGSTVSFWGESILEPWFGSVWVTWHRATAQGPIPDLDEMAGKVNQSQTGRVWKAYHGIWEFFWLELAVKVGRASGDVLKVLGILRLRGEGRKTCLWSPGVGSE